MRLDAIIDAPTRFQARKLRKRGADVDSVGRGSKKKTLTGPAMVFSLKETEILDDFTVLSKVSHSPLPNPQPSLLQLNLNRKTNKRGVKHK